MGFPTKNEANDLTESTINKSNIFSDPDVIVLDLYFSYPIVEEHGEYMNVYIGESDFNHIADGAPVLPVKLVLQEFTFGTEIISVDYEISSSTTIPITKKLSFGKISPRGTDMDEDIYESSNLYPSDWISYHTGGGLSEGDPTTFLSLRVYPVRYYPQEDQLPQRAGLEGLRPADPAARDRGRRHGYAGEGVRRPPNEARAKA